MDVEKHRNSAFFTAFEHRGKRSSQLVCCTILKSELLCKVCSNVEIWNWIFARFR